MKNWLTRVLRIVDDNDAKRSMFFDESRMK